MEFGREKTKMVRKNAFLVDMVKISKFVKLKPNEDVQTWDLNSIEYLGNISEWLWNSTRVEKSQPKSTPRLRQMTPFWLDGWDLATWRSQFISIQRIIWNKSSDFMVKKWRPKGARSGWRHQDSFRRENENIFSWRRNEWRKLFRMNHTSSKLYL